MKSKMTTNSQQSITEPKKKTNPKLSKQLEQEQNHRNGDHIKRVISQKWVGQGKLGEGVQGIRSIIGRHNIEREPWMVWLSGLNTGLQTEELLVWFPVRNMPGLQAGSPVGGVQETTNQCFSPSLSPSFSLSLKRNKYNI